MKLQAERFPHLNAITAHAPDFIEVNRTRHAGSIVVAPTGAVAPWLITSFVQFDPANVPLPPNCEVLLVGTGAKQHFAHPRSLVRWQQAGFGVEFMDTAAACRTYNILMSEDRKVVAALIIEGDS